MVHDDHMTGQIVNVTTNEHFHATHNSVTEGEERVGITVSGGLDQ